MKKKYKDLWKNKWGWAGTIAVLLWWAIIGSGSLENSFSSKLNILISYLNFSYTSDMAGNFASYVLYGSLIGGFIAGLILQKIWGKIK